MMYIRSGGMVVDRIERWTERTLALLQSPKGRRIYARNKSELGLARLNNICGIIRKACGFLKGEDLKAVYDRVEAELAAAKEKAAG
jgi:hypothetical protein